VFAVSNGASARSIKPAIKTRRAQWRRKKSTRARPARSRRREISCTVEFLRRRRGFFRSRRPRRNGESHSYNEAAMAIAADRRRRKRCNAALECRSGSLRAGSYLCAALGPRRDDRGGEGKAGGCTFIARAHPLTVQPRPHSRDSAKSKHGCRRIALVASGRLLSLPPLPPARSNPPPRDFPPLRAFPPASFFPRVVLAAITHAKANTALIYLAASAGITRVIYRDLIAFNSSGATVNHRASRIARVRHACCRYDVITNVRGDAKRGAIARCRAALVNGWRMIFPRFFRRRVSSGSIVKSS